MASITILGRNLNFLEMPQQIVKVTVTVTVAVNFEPEENQAPEPIIEEPETESEPEPEPDSDDSFDESDSVMEAFRVAYSMSQVWKSRFENSIT